jgi:hypothetical protein
MVPIDDSGESIESIKLKLAATEQETKRAERVIGDADATARFAIAKIVVIAYVAIIFCGYNFSDFWRTGMRRASQPPI